MLKWLLVSGLTLLILSPTSLMAQGTITWNFDNGASSTLSPTGSTGSGITGGTISEVNTFSTVPTNLTVTNPSSGGTGGFNYGTAVDNTFTVNTFTLAAPYLEIPITVGASPMSITNFQFDALRASDGAKDYSLRISTDGFATAYQASSGSFTPSGWNNYTGLTGPINVNPGTSTFRLYLFNGNNNVPANLINIQVDNIIATYGVPVPEPTTVFGVSAIGMSCLAMFRRSREWSKTCN